MIDINEVLGNDVIFRVEKAALMNFQGIYIPRARTVKPVKYTENELVTIIKKLEGFGFTPSKALAEELKEGDRTVSFPYIMAFFSVLERFHKGKDYMVFYKGFPEEVMKMSEHELYFNAILHYFFGYVPESDTMVEKVNRQRLYKTYRANLTELDIVDYSELCRKVLSLLNSNVTLSEADLQSLEDLLFVLNEADIRSILDSSDIKMKETLIHIAPALIKRNITVKFSTVTDVLRLIAYLSGEKLDSRHIQFRKFNRTELRYLYTLIEETAAKSKTIGDDGVLYSYPVLDDLLRYEKPWKRFFRLTSQKVNWSGFERTARLKAFLFNSSSSGYITFTGKLNDLFLKAKTRSGEEKVAAISEYISLCSRAVTGHGYFVRNLAALINSLDSEDEEAFSLLTGMLKLICREGTVNRRVLIQLYVRLRNIGLKKDELDIPRVVNAKGTYVEIQETYAINDEIKKMHASRAADMLFDGLKLSYMMTADRDPLRNYLSLFRTEETVDNSAMLDKLDSLILSTSEKDSNVNLSKDRDGNISVLTRGSYTGLNLKENDVIRLFIAWKNLGEERIDIDLSAVVFDNEFRKVGSVFYGDLKGYEHIVHSGDIVDAPEGATEYIDIRDLGRMRELGHRYVLATVNSFTQQTFKELSQLEHCNFGFMQLALEQSNEQLYYQDSVLNGFSLNTDTKNVSTLLFDLFEGRMYIIDASLRSVSLLRNNIENLSSMGEVLRFMIKGYHMTWKDALMLHMTDEEIDHTDLSAASLSQMQGLLI